MLQNRVPLEQQVLPLEEPHLYESRPNANATVKDSGLTLPAIPHVVLLIRLTRIQGYRVSRYSAPKCTAFVLRGIGHSAETLALHYTALLEVFTPFVWIPTNPPPLGTPRLQKPC